MITGVTMRVKLLILFITFSIAAFAAQEVWNYDRNSDADGARILQIVSDGKGGCASVWLDTNDIATVVWLDKKGNVKYENIIYAFLFSPNIILSCSPKQLVHFSGAPIPMIVQVNSKGTPKVIGTLNGYLTGIFMLPIPSQKLTDKKGFFTVNADTNAVYQTLIRYSNK